MGNYVARCEDCLVEFDSLGELKCFTCRAKEESPDQPKPSEKMPRVFIMLWHCQKGGVYSKRTEWTGKLYFKPDERRDEYLSLKEHAHLLAEKQKRIDVLEKVLTDLKHQNHHTIEEEMWRIDEALQKHTDSTEVK